MLVETETRKGQMKEGPFPIADRDGLKTLVVLSQAEEMDVEECRWE